MRTIADATLEDEFAKEVRLRIIKQQTKKNAFEFTPEGLLIKAGKRLYVPDKEGLRGRILSDMFEKAKKSVTEDQLTGQFIFDTYIKAAFFWPSVEEDFSEAAQERGYSMGQKGTTRKKKRNFLTSLFDACGCYGTQ